MLNFLFWYVAICFLCMLLFLAIYITESKIVAEEHLQDFKEILGSDFDKEKEKLNKVCKDYRAYLRVALWFLVPAINLMMFILGLAYCKAIINEAVVKMFKEKLNIDIEYDKFENKFKRPIEMPNGDSE